MNRVRRYVGWLVVAAALGSMNYAAPAVAGLVTTDEAAASSPAKAERDRVKALLARPALARALQARGLSPQQAGARVDALTDQEVHALAGNLDQLPAGGNFTEFQWITIVIGAVIIALLL
ncbi:MAG TPA: PA2779 family protein [Burkholderiales bacterium]|nr:PA2779 family protein [Burkholderiales bacterium]